MKAEKLRYISRSTTKRHRFELPIRSTTNDYMIDENALNDIARFMGFAEVSILSRSFVPEEGKKGALVQSFVYDLFDEDDLLPSKAEWKRIVIYLDVPRIISTHMHLTGDKEFRDLFEELIKEELTKQGKKNLENMSAIGLGLDMISAVYGLLIVTVAFLYVEANIKDNVEFYIPAAIIIKMILSFWDSKVSYMGTQYGARTVPLEITQAYQALRIPSKMAKTKLLHLRQKETPSL